MLARLSSSLPSATVSLARNATSHVRTIPAYIRFNSSQADLEAVQSGEPKKRGVPLAQNLGDIRIRSRNSGDGQQRGGQRPEGGQPRGQQRQNVAPRGGRGERQPGRATEGLRSEQQRPRDGQRQRRPLQAGDALQSDGAVRVQRSAPASPERSPVVIPKSTEIELGNLDELFGSSVSSPSSSRIISATSRKDVTPSQARVQLLLEKTAGDYSRYVPRPFHTTDVRKLGPVKLGELVLSRKRDAGLTARQNVLTVVEKFAGGKGVRAQ